MAVVAASKNSFSVNAYPGDMKTLLAFNFSRSDAAKNLAGFSIACKPPDQSSFYLFNELQFQTPADHAQIAAEKPNSTANAPIQKYRWTHVPGSLHQGLQPPTGNYVYTVTPRYFDDKQSMQALDASLSVSVTVPVNPFQKGALTIGFTRGYMQSEAFAHHFGPDALLFPAGKPLEFDTSQQAGTNPAGQTFTFEDEYQWMGSSARVQIFAVINEVLNDPSLSLDVFAYDFNEPDIAKDLLELAAQGRLRMILDNAKLHTGTATTPTPEDQFTTLFNQQKKAPAEILRGCFDRYSHDKIFIVSKDGTPTQVLTGSTNFSVTGLYVNANHVLVFNEATVAEEYSKVFEESWQVLSQFKTPSTKASNAFAATTFATAPFVAQSATVPKMSINFSPHTKDDASTILGAISDRIDQESSATNGNVLFAVMQLTGSDTPVYNTLKAVHTKQTLFSYGISDAPGGTFLLTPGSKSGVLVTGKPGKTTLPPPFDQVPTPPGHEIHDKFIVCGLNGADPVVYCGSSNLASGGENQNGDNLLEIHDADVATAFAIEALLLVDHYNFLDRFANPKKPTSTATKAPVSSPVATKTPVKKAPAKKSPAKKASAKKAPAKTVKKATAKKTPAKKKAVAKKASAKKALAKKVAVKKIPAKKAPVKKSAKKAVPRVSASHGVRASKARMMAPAKKKSATKKTVSKKAATAQPPAATSSSTMKPLITKQPQSQQKAAVQAGLFLYVNDSWSTRYFDPNDLHFIERELFG